MREPLKEDIARELDLLSTRLPKEIYQNLIQRIQWTINAEIKKKYPMSDEIIEHFKAQGYTDAEIGESICKLMTLGLIAFHESNDDGKD